MVIETLEILKKYCRKISKNDGGRTSENSSLHRSNNNKNNNNNNNKTGKNGPDQLFLNSGNLTNRLAANWGAIYSRKTN